MKYLFVITNLLWRTHHIWSVRSTTFSKLNEFSRPQAAHAIPWVITVIV